MRMDTISRVVLLNKRVRMSYYDKDFYDLTILRVRVRVSLKVFNSKEKAS
jgi:hypothetical protein